MELKKVHEWMDKNNVSYYVEPGEKNSISESPYKVTMRREIPNSDGTRTIAPVPINNPNSNLWVLNLMRRIDSPNGVDTSRVSLEYFSPPCLEPEKEDVPNVDCILGELQDKLNEAGGHIGKVPQPFLGNILVLKAFVGTKSFKELMSL